MRIRKNAKISPLLYSGYALKNETLLQTNVCQLNQSPWDVITFSPSDPSSPLLPPSNQVHGDDSFTGNGSFGDSIGPVESGSCSVASMRNSFHGDEDMKEEGDLKWSFSEPFELTEREIDQQQGFIKNEDADSCRATDIKGWQCRRKAKEGHSSGECHSPSIRGYNNLTPKKNDKLSEAKRRPRPKKAPASSSASNPYEFYYYSGFGPLWGKRRGPSRGETNKSSNNNNNNPNSKMIRNLEVDESIVEDAAAAATTSTNPITTSSSSSQIDDEEFDYVEDEDDDDENGETGKKRARKPIKARSLKSLM